jgi:MFS family permease
VSIRESDGSGLLPTATPVTGGPRPDPRHRLAFGSAVAALAISFAANAAPVPLYNVYRSQDGLTNGAVSLAVVAYSFGTIAALLLLGRLSNYWGRRRTANASVVLTVLGCLMLLEVHSTGSLVAGRLLMGVGSGVASTSLTAYIVDTAPSRPAWLASVASSQGPMFGLAVGAVGSGALVEVGPWPRQLVYAVIVVLLVVTAMLIAVSPETVTPKAGAWRSLRPQVGLPARVTHLLPTAAAVFLATWATGSFYQALVPALVEDQLHTTSPLTIGLVFTAYMAASAFGAPLGGRFTPSTAQRIGMLAFLVAMAGIITAVTSGRLPLFIASTILAGASQGVAISATVRGLLFGSTLGDRAPIFSVIYLLSYSGAAFPSLIAGALSDTVSLPTIALGYGGLTLAATAFTVLAAREPGIAE